MQEPKNVRSFGQRLRQQRQQLSWSQRRLAEAIGATSMSINRWEHDKAIPQLYYREQLCQIFGVDARALGLLTESSEGEHTEAAEASMMQQQERERTALVPIPTVSVWTLPIRRNPFFTGREVILQCLYDAFHAGQTVAHPQIRAISGLGGIGKTQTAVEYAYRFRDDHQVVLWARADTSGILRADVAALAGVLHLPEQDEQDQQFVIEAVKRWLTEQADWLLILDNVEELSTLREVLPLNPRGHILLTTRTPVTGTLAQHLDLEKMGLEEGALLLLRRAKRLAPAASLREATPAQRSVAQDIASLMDGLPLALDQAGAYLEETACDLSAYLEHYQARRAFLLDHRGEGVTDHPQSVSTTFFLAVERVAQANPVAADLLRLCAFLHPDAVAEELIVDAAGELGAVLGPMAADPFVLDTAVKDLRKFSLLRRNPETKTLTIHRLVQAVIKEGMEHSTQRQWAERAVRAVNRVFPDAYDVSAWPRCQRFLPHALACAALITQWNMTLQEAGELLYRAGNYLRRRGHYSQAEPLLRQALGLLEKTLGSEHLSIAQHLNDLALLYISTGQWTQAETLFRQSLTLRDKIGGPDHPDTAESLHNLGYLYCEQGRYAEAEPLFRRAVQIYEQAVGPDHPNIACLLTSLGFIHNVREQYTQAEPLLQRALLIQERALGPDHLDLADTLNNLGYTSFAQGCYNQAEACHERALALREKALGPGHPDVAVSLSNLGKVSFAQERDQQAEAFHRRALAIREKALGPDHFAVTRDLLGLGKLSMRQGDYQQAECLLKLALTIREQTREADHPDIAECFVLLRELHAAQGGLSV